MTPATLRLFGRLELRHGLRMVGLSPAQRRLVGFIGLQDHPLSRPAVAGMLWPDADEARAAGNLRSALWRIRCRAPDVIDSDEREVALARGVSVDARQLQAAAMKIIKGEDVPGQHSSLFPSADDLLPGWYDDWVIFERERCRQLFIRALEVICHRSATHGRFADAIEAGLRAVSLEPLRESAHRALIDAHLKEGNACEAMRQYEIYRELVKEELGVEPSPEMVSLVTVD